VSPSLVQLSELQATLAARQRQREQAVAQRTQHKEVLAELAQSLAEKEGARASAPGQRTVGWQGCHAPACGVHCLRRRVRVLPPSSIRVFAAEVLDLDANTRDADKRHAEASAARTALMDERNAAARAEQDAKNKRNTAKEEVEEAHKVRRSSAGLLGSM
jgi:hypothetical protein